MNSTKKIIAHLLPIFFALALYACSNSDDTQTTGPDPVQSNVPKAVDDAVSTVKNVAIKLDSLLSNDTIYDYAPHYRS